MTFEEPSFTNTMPPCSRYEGGEDDSRVSQVYAFAMGLLGGSHRARTVAQALARLHDHKGELIVAYREGLPEDAQTAFRRAWSQVGHEPATNVSFVHVHSDAWRDVWASIRFDSAWTPE